MSLVEVSCTADEARQLTDRIKVGVEAVWQLIADAYQRGAHLALGYKSWDDYTTREFGTARLRLPKEDRTEVVMSLRHAGLSVRAIVAATGVSDKTVLKELRQVSESTTPAKPLDRTEVVPNFKKSAGVKPTAATPTASVEATDAVKVKGMDGKSYPVSKPSPKQERRKPFTDTLTSVGWDVRKAADRVVRLFDDDRFTQQQAEVAARMRGHLEYSVEVCQDLLDLLNQQPKEQ